MITAEELRKLFFEVRDQGRELSDKEVLILSTDILSGYHEIFSLTLYFVFHLVHLILKKPEVLNTILDYPLDDNDLGYTFDAIKYSDLIEQHLIKIWEYIDFDKYVNGWDYSCMCALNVISYYIYSTKDIKQYKMFYDRFINNVNIYKSHIINPKYNERFLRFLNSYYSELLFTYFGRDRINMSFEIEEIIKSEINIPNILK